MPQLQGWLLLHGAHVGPARPTSQVMQSGPVKPASQMQLLDGLSHSWLAGQLHLEPPAQGAQLGPENPREQEVQVGAAQPVAQTQVLESKSHTCGRPSQRQVSRQLSARAPAQLWAEAGHVAAANWQTCRWRQQHRAHPVALARALALVAALRAVAAGETHGARVARQASPSGFADAPARGPVPQLREWGRRAALSMGKQPGEPTAEPAFAETAASMRDQPLVSIQPRTWFVPQPVHFFAPSAQALHFPLAPSTKPKAHVSHAHPA